MNAKKEEEREYFSILHFFFKAEVKEFILCCLFLFIYLERI